jgi:quercetin dioxygenase-like cupin family protein
MYISNQPEIKIVSKGWGFEKWIVNTEKYCGKLLYIIKNKKSSLHYHKIKDETFYVHSGKVRIFYSDDLNDFNNYMSTATDQVGNIYMTKLQQIVLNRGDNFYIPAGRIHQIIAVEDTELYEFSTTHTDSDSYRLIKGD